MSNGPTEATNNLIKRVAFGFRRFRNHRIRTLLYAERPNWDLLATITPAEIRGTREVLHRVEQQYPASDVDRAAAANRLLIGHVFRPKGVNLNIGVIAVLRGRGDRLHTAGVDPGADPQIEACIERNETPAPLPPPVHRFSTN